MNLPILILWTAQISGFIFMTYPLFIIQCMRSTKRQIFTSQLNSTVARYGKWSWGKNNDTHTESNYEIPRGNVLVDYCIYVVYNVFLTKYLCKLERCIYKLSFISVSIILMHLWLSYHVFSLISLRLSESCSFPLWLCVICIVFNTCICLYLWNHLP